MPKLQERQHRKKKRKKKEKNEGTAPQALVTEKTTQPSTVRPRSRPQSTSRMDPSSTLPPESCRARPPGGLPSSRRPRAATAPPPRTGPSPTAEPLAPPRRRRMPTALRPSPLLRCLARARACAPETPTDSLSQEQDRRIFIATWLA